jgi:hypothetical protein
MGQNAITEKAIVGNLPLSLPGPNNVPERRGVTAAGCLEKICLKVAIFCLSNWNYKVVLNSKLFFDI